MINWKVRLKNKWFWLSLVPAVLLLVKSGAAVAGVELDFGDLSGWIYHVNGFAPPVGCGEYVLEDGDKIEWLYSCDIGNDLRD